jgi:hypothetical protein
VEGGGEEGPDFLSTPIFHRGGEKKFSAPKLKYPI